MIYPVGVDIAYAGFIKNAAQFERYSSGSDTNGGYTYGVGPDVAVGAPNIATKVEQYDPTASMFEFADYNHDGTLDLTELSSLMRSV